MAFLVHLRMVNMHIALISDVHANVVALDAVLADIDARGISLIVCAGDLVGYNAFPRETLARLRTRGAVCVHGNHDLMAVGRLPLDGCGPLARRASVWTRAVLTPRERAELAALPAVVRLRDGVLCLHAAVGDTRLRVNRPAEFRAQAEAVRAIDPDVRICVIGHTHTPGATLVTPDGRIETHRTPSVTLTTGGLWFVNPGSVGEPRDADLRASYALLDWWSWRVTFCRVGYDTARVAHENLRRLPPLEAPPWRERVWSGLRTHARAAARAFHVAS